MKDLFNFKKQTVAWAFLSWLLPLFVSFFFVNPETKEYTINIWVFKGLMAAILAAVTYVGYNKIAAKGTIKMPVPNTFLAVNVVGDILVLLLAFGVPVLMWITTILPIYIVCIYGLYALKNR